MEVDEYRERIEAEVAKAESVEEPARARAGARPSAAARAKAIALEPAGEERLDQRVPELLATLRNAKEPLTVRMAALQALGALDFLGPRFDPFRADYKQALRDVATDPAEELREAALELLAIEKDTYAQQLLVRSLEEPEDAVVGEARAIQLLGYDDHAEIVPLVRRVFERSKGATREEALRVLATDPGSERLLARLLKDKSEKRNIRRISASGLQSLNPDAFERTARTIVGDESDDDDIRASTLAALAHGRESREKPADRTLVETVEKLAEKQRSPAMRSSIRRFLRSIEE